MRRIVTSIAASYSEQDAPRVLARRIRAAALIALVALPVFGLADAWTPNHHPLGLLATKLCQLVLVLWTIVAARRATTHARVQSVALRFVAGLVLTSAAAAMARRSVEALPLILVIAVIAPPVLIAWGARKQAFLAAVAVLAATVVYAAGPGLASAFPFPALPLAVALATSLYAAAEADRHQRAREAMEMARRESEDRFRVLAETAPVLIWMTNDAGECTYLNPEWERFLGHATSPRESERLWNDVHPDDREAARTAMLSATGCRDPWEVEYRIRAKGGRYRWLLTRGTPRFTPDGHFEGYVGSATDITARKEEAELAAAARNAAVEAARLKSDFLATLSHEIRTPMHGIFGMTELALDTPDEAERRTFLERARSCAETLMRLLDDILDFSRIEAGRLELSDEPLDVREVVRQAVDTLSLAAARKGLALTTDVEPSVPVGLRGDPSRLRQILVNLVGNAIKFTEEGSVEVSVTSSPHPRTPGTVLLSCVVRDTGIGIPPDRLSSIFDAFTQVDASISRKYGGTGLGLAITHRLVDLLGGTIAVKSTEALGSTFCFTIPLALDQEATLRVSRSS
ncbi:MAG TPA: ATP-binding protein [Candidatus Limnocylindria bacterium]|nr:ATP-binding protein [Candidatus Limnocylindria bacterium]